jgi:outer membrane protein OmpA-like peptidoglycan-associated protein
VDEGESDPNNPDTDGGGIPDGEEVANGDDPTAAGDDADEPLNFAGGTLGGCSATQTNAPASGFGILLVLGAALTMRARRRRTLVAAAAAAVAAAVVAPGMASAQDGFSVQSLAPSPSREFSYIEGRQARVGYPRAWNAVLFTSYANNPLVLRDEQGERQLSVIEHQVVTDLLGSFAPTRWLDFGVAVPMFQYQSGNSLPAAGIGNDVNAGWGIGDIRLSARGIVIQPADGEGGPALGFAGTLSLPTGREDAFQGSPLSGDVGVLFDWVFAQGTRIGFNALYRIGGKTELENIEQNDTVALTLASAVQLTQDGDWFLVPEINGDIAVAAGGVGEVNSPVEGLLAVRWLGVDHLMTELGLGTGLVPGAGSPDFRVFFSIGGRSEAPAPVEVVVDPCADTPEDFDGFEDEDGCLDPDNDGDGVLDVNDGVDMACANDPEDFDQFEDEDGCPDPDNDQDGVLDVNDGVDMACANDPEDDDDFEDENGCPDPDNDQDGILDLDDACMNVAEDADGNEDTDGCPEEELVTLNCEEINIGDSVYFETDSDVIQERSYALLDEVAAAFTRATYLLRIRVEGHTDDQGPDRYNLNLSRRRAASVMRYLVEEGGIDPARLESEGFGETQPIDVNTTDEGRARNRRVVFIVVERDAQCETP